MAFYMDDETRKGLLLAAEALGVAPRVFLRELLKCYLRGELEVVRKPEGS